MCEWVKLTRVDGKSFLVNSMNIGFAEGYGVGTMLHFNPPIQSGSDFKSPTATVLVMETPDQVLAILNGEQPVSPKPAGWKPPTELGPEQRGIV